MIDRLLAELEAQLSETPEPAELRDQLARLNSTIESHSSAIGELTARRNRLAEQLRTSQQTGAAARNGPVAMGGANLSTARRNERKD